MNATPTNTAEAQAIVYTKLGTVLRVPLHLSPAPERQFMRWFSRQAAANPGFPVRVKSMLFITSTPLCADCRAALLRFLDRYRLADRVRLWATAPAGLMKCRCQSGAPPATSLEGILAEIERHDSEPDDPRATTRRGDMAGHLVDIGQTVLPIAAQVLGMGDIGPPSLPDTSRDQAADVRYQGQQLDSANQSRRNSPGAPPPPPRHPAPVDNRMPGSNAAAWGTTRPAGPPSVSPLAPHYQVSGPAPRVSAAAGSWAQAPQPNVSPLASVGQARGARLSGPPAGWRQGEPPNVPPRLPWARAQTAQARVSPSALPGRARPPQPRVSPGSSAQAQGTPPNVMPPAPRGAGLRNAGSLASPLLPPARRFR